MHRLNRLIRLENRNGAGDLISGYGYLRHVAGSSPYSMSKRLVSWESRRCLRRPLPASPEEDITDPVLGNETISYTCPTTSRNRLSRTDSSGTVNYGYDDIDRLISEGNVTYTYDDNGNMLSKSDGTETVTYGYDYENRLVFMQNSEGTTEPSRVR